MKYTIFWLTGEAQIVKGDSVSEAMTNAGIGAGAIRAMDFFEEGDKRKYWKWNKEKHRWEKIVEFSNWVTSSA